MQHIQQVLFVITTRGSVIITVDDAVNVLGLIGHDLLQEHVPGRG